MSISVMICDDLPEERGNLIRMLRHYEQEKDIELDLETAADGTELLSLWKPDRWDLVLLDIFMPQLNGIDTARRLREVDRKCEIVFATTSREHGVEGYELHALDYLTKPISQQDVDGMMDWFLRKRAEQRRELTVRTPLGEETVPVGEIRYIESRGHSCDIHLPQRVVSVRRSIDELETLLPLPPFVRCHRSYIVRLDAVERMSYTAAALRGGESLPLGRKYVKALRASLEAWQEGEPH